MERKSARRPAWWMYAIAASYAVTFGLILYQTVWGPAELRGFAAAFTDGTMVIRSVEAGSPESNGGLRPGDRVVTIDDQLIRAVRDWIAATGNLQVGRPQRWLVAREEDHLSLEIHPVGVSIRQRIAEGYLNYFSLVFTGLALGLLIAWKRPGDAVGRLGAWFMVTASIAFGFPSPSGSGSRPPSLPLRSHAHSCPTGTRGIDFARQGGPSLPPRARVDGGSAWGDKTFGVPIL